MSSMGDNYTYEQGHDAEHNDTSMEDSDGKDMILSYDQMMTALRFLMFGITPAISFFGIVGNISSIIVLSKQGLHKCSNILLISLAVSDLTFLITVNSVPKLLYEVVGIDRGFDYSKEVSQTLFVLYNFFIVLDYSSCCVSFSMPMLITFERLVAVYLPFKFTRIVTPTRTWCVIVVFYLFWFSSYAYMSFWLSLSYTHDPHYNVFVGRMVRSTLFENNPSAVEAFGEVLNYMVLKIPLAVTLVGCVLISVKVRMASSSRKKMTQVNSRDSSSSNRTTKMLLAVCAVYMITSVILAIPTYVPQYVQWSLFSEHPTNLSPVIYQIIDTSACINSSANFIVYVVMNKKFRDTYKSLFTCCRRPKR